jgi:hypothetical protein
MAFKSNDRTFEKVYGIFDKRDYFNAQGLAKVQIGNFERALQKNDKGAQQILDKFKGDMDKAKEYIIQVITDRKKEEAFNQYKAFKAAVDSIQKGKPIYGAVDLVKSRIHNSSQKYTIALYSALRNKKFTKWKDVHNDVDSLIGESVNEVKVNYNFSEEELKRVLKLLGRSASTEVKMIKAFEKAFGRKLTRDELFESLNEGKVHFEKKLKSGNIFQVTDRDTKGMRGTQDKFSMQIVDKRGKVIKHIGSHPSLDGAKKYSNSIKEGKKRFKRQDGIGKAKYTISYHDGKQKHKDGSDFYGIQIFRNQKDLEKFRTALLKKGYREDSGYKKESVNETEVEQIAKKTKSETAFYDVLSKIEKKYGKRNYRLWLEKSLKDLGINAKHYDYRTNAAAEEKLYQLTK